VIFEKYLMIFVVIREWERTLRGRSGTEELSGQVVGVARED
jgi:hypothetical protein